MTGKNILGAEFCKGSKAKNKKKTELIISKIPKIQSLGLLK